LLYLQIYIGGTLAVALQQFSGVSSDLFGGKMHIDEKRRPIDASVVSELVASWVYRFGIHHIGPLARWYRDITGCEKFLRIELLDNEGKHFVPTS